MKMDSTDELLILFYKRKYVKWCICFSTQHEIHFKNFVHHVAPYIRTFDFNGKTERSFNYYLIDIQGKLRQIFLLITHL